MSARRSALSRKHSTQRVSVCLCVFSCRPSTQVIFTINGENSLSAKVVNLCCRRQCYWWKSGLVHAGLSSVLWLVLVTFVYVLRGRQCTAGSIAKRKHLHTLPSHGQQLSSPTGLSHGSPATACTYCKCGCNLWFHFPVRKHMLMHSSRAVLCRAVCRPAGETGKSVSQYAAEWLKTVPLMRSTIKGSKGLSNVLVSNRQPPTRRKDLISWTRAE
jgi:hypothetical protein